MSSVLSPLAPVTPLTREGPVGPHAARPVTPVETARAVRPVQPDTAAELVRNPASHERPVGPPPTFDVNVLQDIRARLKDAPPPEDAAEPAEADEPAAPAVEAPPIEFARVPEGPEETHALDKKV